MNERQYVKRGDWKAWKNSHRSAEEPSPLMKWHEAEMQKKKAGLPNEIDLNLIKSCLDGHYTNDWYPVVKKHPEVFSRLFAKNQKADWNEIYKLKSGQPEKSLSNEI